VGFDVLVLEKPLEISGSYVSAVGDHNWDRVQTDESVGAEKPRSYAQACGRGGHTHWWGTGRFSILTLDTLALGV
jgi:hypothetical protein